MIKPLGSNVVILVEMTSESETSSGIILKTNNVKTRLKLVEVGTESDISHHINMYVEVRTSQFQVIQQDEDSPKYLIGPEAAVIGVYNG